MASALRFLRQPNRPIAPRPVAKSGRAAGNGVTGVNSPENPVISALHGAGFSPQVIATAVAKGIPPPYIERYMRRVFPDHRRTKQKTASRQSTARSYWGSAMSANGMVGRALAPPVIEAGKEYQGQRTWCCDARSTSATGHSRPTHSVPVPIDVRCYSNSDIIVRRSEVTLRADFVAEVV
jgi:hypothetical protein